jgi:hypothetical protein
MPTALLICLENTFWDMSYSSNEKHDFNFMESFKKAYTLYVESGMRNKLEADIDIFLRNQAGNMVTKEFEAMFHKFIIDHYLRMFHCFYLSHPSLMTF